MMFQTVSLILATLCFVAIYLTKGPHLLGFRLLMLVAGTGLVFDYSQNALYLFQQPFSVSFMLALGPCYFLFVQCLLLQRPSKLKLIFHSLPFFISIPFVSNVQWLILLGSASQITYLYFALRLSRRYHYSLQQQTSDAFAHELRWINLALWIFTANAILDLVRLNLQMELGPLINNFWQMLSNLVSIFLVAFLLKQLLYKNKVFSKWEVLVNQSSSHADLNPHQIFKEIHQHIIDNQLYLIPRLAIRDVSEQIGLNEKDISWAINKGGHLSFNDFINQLRIEHFKQRLGHPGSNGNILELAFECGFNSKSSFNAVFKKHTGFTPTAYIKATG